MNAHELIAAISTKRTGQAGLIVKPEHQAAILDAWKSGNKDRTGDVWDIAEIEIDHLPRLGGNDRYFMADCDETHVWVVSEFSGDGVEVTDVIRELVGG